MVFFSLYRMMDAGDPIILVESRRLGYKPHLRSRLYVVCSKEMAN